MRPLPTLLAFVPALVPMPALAHVGHLGDLAGHDHWIAGAAIGAAVLAGLWGAWAGKGEPEPEASEPDPDQSEEASS